MNRKKMAAAVLTAALCASMALPAQAAINPFAHMEAASRQAVASAIKAGTIPPGSTIYDCMYGADANGKTIVIQYKDQDGNWIDVGTQKAVETAPAAQTVDRLSEETLAEYAAEVFRLVNVEREKAGLEPLECDPLLDEAAMIRASEVNTVDNAGGAPHTRPDGTSFRTVLTDLGIDGDRCAENLNRAKATPQAAMDSWMQSDGHRDIILRERYGSVGIGVYQRPDGKLDWIQIFERK